jgi:hypothetical protein
MLWTFIFIAIVVTIILIPFIFPNLSPIPYLPTNKRDIPVIIQSLNLQNDQIIFDLGAGDGVVIFKAALHAKKHGLNTKFIALEINPLLVFIMHLKGLFHPNRGNISIKMSDMFKHNYIEDIPHDDTKVTFYLYLSPWYIEKMINIIKSLDIPVKIISYFYPIHSLKAFEKRLEVNTVHKVYRYEISSEN